MRRSLFVGLISAVLVLPLAAPALAATQRPRTIDVGFCQFIGGQYPPVAANTPLSLQELWAAKSLGEENLFVGSSELTVVVNGVPVANPESYWQAPEPIEDGLWSVAWVYPTGISLKAGQSITVYFRHDLTNPVYDGFGHTSSGTLLEVTCTAKALPSA